MAAVLPNIELFYQMGIDPKNKLPLKFGGCDNTLKQDIKKALRIIDEQDACGRYVWKNIPDNMPLTSQEIERMLYYRGQLAFFYIKELDTYCLLPYALDGTIDMYGRFNTIHPVPFANGTDEKKLKAVADYLAEKKLTCVYKPEMALDKPVESVAVLLHDYTKQLSQTIIPRVDINDPILDVMANCIPYMNTRLMLSTGVKGVRVADADQQASVLDGSRRLKMAAQQGDAYVPIVGSIEFQDLSADQAGKAQEFMLAMQSLDNFRLSTYGIDNGGLFEKKQHVLESEQEVNGQTSGLVLQDGLEIRKYWANTVNKIFGLNLEPVINQSSQPQVMGGEEEESMEGEPADDTSNDSAI